MVFRITKKTTRKQLDEWLASLPPSKVMHLPGKPFDATKYYGKLKRNLDGLTLQKQFRNEWK
jgi:hypothetical protein